MKLRTVAAPVAAIAILALAGCGASTPGSGTAANATTAPSASPAVSLSVVSDPTTIGAYVPPASTAHVGDTVQWTFADKNPHSVTSDQDGLFDSTPMADGKTFSFTFTQAGSFAYHCSIHPEMHGTITVAP